jgi:hypothetical protein
MLKPNRVLYILGKRARISLMGHGVIGAVILLFSLVGFLYSQLTKDRDVSSYEFRMLQNTLGDLPDYFTDRAVQTKFSRQIDSEDRKILIEVAKQKTYLLKEENIDKAYNTPQYKTEVGSSYFRVEDTLSNIRIYITQNRDWLLDSLVVEDIQPRSSLKGY